MGLKVVRTNPTYSWKNETAKPTDRGIAPRDTGPHGKNNPGNDEWINITNKTVRSCIGVLESRHEQYDTKKKDGPHEITSARSQDTRAQQRNNDHRPPR